MKRRAFPSFPAAVLFGAVLTACSFSLGVPRAPTPISAASKFSSASAKPGLHKRGFTALAVSDQAEGELLLYDSTYNNFQTIELNKYYNRLEGDAFDRQQNLYLTDSQFGSAPANYVFEYRAYSGYGYQLSFVYSNFSYFDRPLHVTTDRYDNVYVTTIYGNVFEFPQHVNTPAFECSVGAEAWGVAVDRAGDVFVATNSYTRYGGLVEFPGGLASCSETTLPLTFQFAAGLAIDNKRDLVLADNLVGVDIIPPPYTAIGSTITLPDKKPNYNGVALTASNSTLFVADGNGTVYATKYPSGKVVKTLTLYGAWGVAVYPPSPK